jgi:tetratricopeptide (TPR) repeat protein
MVAAMLLRSFTCALVIACVIAPLSTGTARAQDANTEAAKIHYKAGEQYYVRGLYSQAIAEFKEAYRLSKASALLFNMSQAYERMGDLPSARDALQRYIDSGETDPGELPALKEKLAILDKRIADGSAPPEAVERPPVEDEAPGRPLRTWKWVTGGVGVGLVTLSVLFMLDGNKQEQALEDYVMEHPNTEFEGESLDIYNRGKRANRLAVAFGIGGAAVAATAGVFFYLDAKHARERTPPPSTVVVPVVGPGLAGAQAIFRF